MPTVEQLVVEANAVSARQALYASRMRMAAEDGDRAGIKHWLRRAAREEHALEEAKARLVDAQRIHTLRLGGASVGEAVMTVVAESRPPIPPSAMSPAEAARVRALISQARLVVEG